ncbi:MAG: hypothetical protein ACETWM_08955 [Candidatus Lokiarchaeia archaeon]
MITDGILSKGEREEINWKETKFKEPYKVAIERFREEVLGRPDFDPTTLLIWGIYMSMGVLQIMEDVEENFGPEGQKVVSEALRKIGYDIAKQSFEDAEFPEGTPDIEKASFVATWINTVFWTSIENPEIVSEDEAILDILWCPHQDMYKPFDCRVQRYLVEGVLRYLRENMNLDFELEFQWIIPAGAETCRFRLWKKKEGEERGQWEKYSKMLAQRALKRMKAKKGQK